MIALALLILLGGAFAWGYFPNQFIGGATMLFGAGLLLAAIWWLGRRIQRSRYRRTIWRRPDTLLTGAALVTILVTLSIWLTQRGAFVFYPYPRLTWPTFNPLIAVTLLLLAGPALAGRFSGARRND
jgi:hypothetical protein